MPVSLKIMANVFYTNLLYWFGFSDQIAWLLIGVPLKKKKILEITLINM